MSYSVNNIHVQCINSIEYGFDHFIHGCPKMYLIVHLMVLSLHCFTLGFDLLKYIDVAFSIADILLLKTSRKKDGLK